MKLLLIGSGSREHALLWKLKQNPRITECYVAPGNAGTGTMAVNVPIEATNIAGLLQFAEEKKIDLTIVGDTRQLGGGDDVARNRRVEHRINPRRARGQQHATPIQLEQRDAHR